MSRPLLEDSTASRTNAGGSSGVVVMSLIIGKKNMDPNLANGAALDWKRLQGHPKGVDLRTASRLLAIAALLGGAWFFVRTLKPKETELQTLDSRSAEFGDMSSAASRRPNGEEEANVRGLDMVPTSSLPESGPQAPPEPEPPQQPTEQAAPPPPEPYQPPPPVRKPRRELPRLEKVASDLGGQAATSGAFLANPEESSKDDEKKKKKK